MKKTKTYTSTLPDDVMGMVNEYSVKYKVPKNKVVEKALRRFFFELKREEYREGFRKMANDPEIVAMAEEGIADWAEMLERYDRGEL